MEGKRISHEGIHVYPEYYRHSTKQLFDMSMAEEGLFIASVLSDNQNIAVAFSNGIMRYKRAKHRIPSMEKDIVPGIEKPEVVRLHGKNILILICYELVFPEDYIVQTEVDVIVHMVGFPMYDENQKEGWVGIQRALSLTYQCPLICSCGGPEGAMNISGVMLPPE